jgi:hypothetical protein
MLLVGMSDKSVPAAFVSSTLPEEERDEVLL